MKNSTNATCTPLLLIAPEDVLEVAENLTRFAMDYVAGLEEYENIGSVVDIGNDSNSSVYTLPNIELDISDTRSEKIHTFDSAALLLIMALLFLAVITIWVFKAKRLRVFHETGLSLIYGTFTAPGKSRGYMHNASKLKCAVIQELFN